MTSVLYSAGLNYQSSNPLRTEIRGIRSELEELRKLIVNQADVINGLNVRLVATEKTLKAVNQTVAANTTVPTPASKGNE